MYLFTKL